jgi:hypothetical protein
MVAAVPVKSVFQAYLKPLPSQVGFAESVREFAVRRTPARVIAFCFLAPIAVLISHRPDYDDWDIVAYVAVALRYAGMPSYQVHDAAFHIMQGFLPSGYWDLLIGHGNIDPEFRRAVTDNISDFMAQLPFYYVKPVYPLLMALFYGAGLSLPEAGMDITGAAYFGFGLLLYSWFRGWMSPLTACVVMALLMMNPYLVAMGRTIGPDMLSDLAIVFAAFLMMEHRRLALASAAILMLSVLIRPENILYAGTFLLYMGWNRSIRLPWVGFLLVGTAAVYLVMARLSGNYGWQTQFVYTFVSKAATPSVEHHGAWYYLGVYVRHIDRILFGRGELPIFVLVGFGTLCLKSHKAEMWADRYVHLVLICFVLAVTRMIVLPTEAARGLLPVYMLLAVAFIGACSELMSRDAVRRIV